MTEFRVRDVFTANNPLIGLPGRIGEYPDQGSHPGPLSFYLLAPTYRILGSSSWALETATVVIHLAAISTALWIGQRRLGWKGVAAVAALLALAIRGYGQVLLTQPWNPYLPLLAWLLVLLATWAVLCGDHRMLIPLVVAATLCAQTHVPYLPLGAGLTVVALVATLIGLRRTPADERPAVRRSLMWSVGIGVVLWIPPLLDQLTNQPGNIRELADHFGSPPEPAIGLGEGLRIMGRHLDAWYGLGTQFIGHRAVRRHGVGLAWRCHVPRLGRGRRRCVPDRLAGSPGPARRHRRGPAARHRVDGADLRAAVVLPDAVGLGHHDVARRRRPVDRGRRIPPPPSVPRRRDVRRCHGRRRLRSWSRWRPRSRSPPTPSTPKRG